MRIALNPADGTWLVSDSSDGPSKDWRITGFNLQDIIWHRLDIVRITKICPVAKPDLSKVEEIGFTDLMPGGLSASCSRIDWIEMYSKPEKK